MKPLVIIGIDPDRGIAVGADKRVYEARTVKDVQEVKKAFKALTRPYRVVCAVVEKSPNKRVYPRPGVSVAVMAKIAWNVGENQRKADELIGWVREQGVPVYVTRPVAWRGRACKKGTKHEHALFCKITGWPETRRLSEHARDAVMLIWQIRPETALQYAKAQKKRTEKNDE